MVAVAQLVEPRIVIPVVVGSSPISHPSFFSLYFPLAIISKAFDTNAFSGYSIVACILILQRFLDV